MTPTNLTSYVSVDPEHGVIVTMQIDDISGQIDFYFNHGVADQATATKDHRVIIRSNKYIHASKSGELTTCSIMGCLVDIGVKTGIPYEMIKQNAPQHSAILPMSLTVINCFAKG